MTLLQEEKREEVKDWVLAVSVDGKVNDSSDKNFLISFLVAVVSIW